LIAEKYANTVSDRLPSDVNPMNSRNQSELASYVRDRSRCTELSTDELTFVERAINFIENYDLGQAPPSNIWPSEQFLYKWVKVPWCFYNNSTIHLGVQWDQMRAIRCGTIVQREKFNLEQLKAAVLNTKARIKFRDGHFFALPSSHCNCTDLDDCIADLAGKLAVILGCPVGKDITSMSEELKQTANAKRREADSRRSTSTPDEAKQAANAKRRQTRLERSASTPDEAKQAANAKRRQARLERSASTT
jgi:hypothetical protein